VIGLTPSDKYRGKHKVFSAFCLHIDMDINRQNNKIYHGEVVMRNQIIRKIIVWVLIIVFFTGVSPAFSASRIMPTGSVKVYKGEKLVQVLKQESALPDGAMLTTEGRCGVRSENFYLAADDGCTFSITDSLNRKDLRVDKGVAYFAINQKTGKLAFITPAGDISTQQIRSNADINGGIVKGYLDVSETKVQLGVLEGGSLVVATASGVQEIRAGKQITLAMADPIKIEDNEKDPVSAEGEEAATDEEETGGAAETDTAAETEETVASGEGIGGKIPAAYYIGGSVLAGAILIGIVANQGGGGDSPGPTSPASP
jgi:hypothetical protein